MIRVQTQDFDPGLEVIRLTAKNGAIGGVCMFLGLVRDVLEAESTHVQAMTLEHYPGMTERQLETIEAEARRRWPLEDVLIIHRYGRLEACDRIVLVATASAHREAAFQSCHFLMDWLKTKAPFWKIEHTSTGDHWVAARASDEEQTKKWVKEESP